MKAGNDLTKIYMVNSPGGGSLPQGNLDPSQYQRRLTNNQSPSQADLKTLAHPNGGQVGGINQVGANHFHNRN